MLILTRKINETIVINDDILVTILSSKGNQIRLGLTAPPNVSIHRAEIYNRIIREKNFTSKEHFTKLRKGIEDSYHTHADYIAQGASFNGQG